MNFINKFFNKNNIKHPADPQTETVLDKLMEVVFAQFNDKTIILRELEDYHEIKTTQKLPERLYRYIPLYFRTEVLILGHKPPDIKKEYDRNSFHDFISQNVNIGQLPYYFRIIFKKPERQLFEFYKILLTQQLVNMINLIGIHKINQTLKQFCKGTFLENSSFDGYFFHDNYKLRDNLPRSEILKEFRVLYQKINHEIETLLGVRMASELQEKTLNFFVRIYGYNFLSDLDGVLVQKYQKKATMTGNARKILSRLNLAEITDKGFSNNPTLWISPKTGKRIPVSVTGTAIRNKEGAITGIILAIKDLREFQLYIMKKLQNITPILQQISQGNFSENIPVPQKEDELHQHLNTLKSMITDLKELDKAKTEFISIASHQLRTPLTGIKWFLEMLIKGEIGKLSSDQLNTLKQINSSNERLIDLVNALLNISRIESGRLIIDPVPTDLVKLVRSVIEELKPIYQKRHQDLVFTSGKDIPQNISIDPNLIRHVYMNLLTNAIKYTQDNGKINIEITKDESSIISKVSDNGYGIPENLKHRIFQKFFRAENVIKRETDGTGLGLYLVKAVVESSGGSITFDSQENIGTTFVLRLPLKGSIVKEGEVALTNNQ